MSAPDTRLTGPRAEITTLALAWALAGTGVAAAGDVAPSPVELPDGHFERRTCAKVAYPDEARRNGWDGSVHMRLHIDATGRVARVDVEHSSGHAILDEAAQVSLKSCRFPPATVDGVAVASTTRTQYVWMFDDNRLGGHLSSSADAPTEASDIGKAQLFGISAVPAGARDAVLRDLQYQATLDAGCANLEAARFEPASAADAPKLAPPGKGMLQDVRDVHERWHVRQCGNEVRYLITVRLHEDSLVRHHAVFEGSRRLPAAPKAAPSPASGPSGKGP